jgi:hypothetical protein
MSSPGAQRRLGNPQMLRNTHPPDGRLTNSTLFRDGGEASFLNCSDERLQRIQSVHIASPFLYGMDCILLVDIQIVNDETRVYHDVRGDGVEAPHMDQGISCPEGEE